MKLREWKIINNINNDKEMMEFFRYNLHFKKLPVAMYSCMKCDEILYNPPFECKVCKGEVDGISE